MATSITEHPALVAERLVRFAGIVGREWAVAGTNCGLATVGDSTLVNPAVAQAKLGSLAEGARRASDERWN